MRLAWEVGERGRLDVRSAEAEARILLLGRRWMLPILLELVDRPHRFSSLKRSLPDVSANVLAQRLRELVDAAVVVRSAMPPPVSVTVYSLSEDRPGLRSALRAVSAWATGPIAAGETGQAPVGEEAL